MFSITEKQHCFFFFIKRTYQNQIKIHYMCNIMTLMSCVYSVHVFILKTNILKVLFDKA